MCEQQLLTGQQISTAYIVLLVLLLLDPMKESASKHLTAQIITHATLLLHFNTGCCGSGC